MINKISVKLSMLIVLPITMLFFSVGAIANTAPIWLYTSEPEIETITVVEDLTLPKTIEVADFNDDGSLDVITASNNYSKPSLYWYDNSAPWEQNLITDRSRMDMFAVGDMDGDGDIDVIAGSSIYKDMYWYENGNDWAETLISVETYSRSFITVADIDGDGDLDVISGSSSGDIITWYENDNSWAELTITTNVDSPRDVQIADMDGDGDLDVLSASYNDDKIAWFENGNNWTETVITDNANGAKSLKVGDLDADGDLDVLVSSYIDSTVAWFENGNDWNQTIIIDLAGYHEHIINIADIDGDADLDFLIASEYYDTISWYENGNDWYQHNISTQSGDMVDILAEDMDGDGNQDVLLLSYTASYSVTLFKLQGYNSTAPLYLDVLEGGTDVALPIEVYDEDSDAITYSLTGPDSVLFTVSSTGTISFITASDYFLFADSNKDNIFEITLTASDGVSSVFKKIRVEVLLGPDSDNDGVTDAKELLDGTDPNDYHSKLDTDGDGVPDRLEPYFGGDINTPDAIDSDGDGVSDYIELFYGENDAPHWIAKTSNGEHWKLTHLDDARQSSLDISISDLTGDGIKDIVSSSSYRLEVLDGANDFIPTTLYESQVYTEYDSVKVSDLTNDGIDNPDIIVSGLSEGVFWYEHDTWVKRPITDDRTGGEVKAYDIDFDGDLDIIATYNYQIVWYENGNAWARHVLVDLGNEINHFELIDYDLDGDKDIVAVSQSIDRISWFENNEIWEEHVISSNVDSPYRFTLKDIDSDGLFDILVWSYFGDFTLLKQSDGWQESKLDFLDNCKTNLDLTISDMDNDGLLDIACAESSDVVWFNAADNWSRVEIQTDPRYIDKILFDDVDNDSDVDIISINSSTYYSNTDDIYINFNTNEVSNYSLDVPDLSSEIKLPFIAFDLDGQNLSYSLSGYDAKYFSVDGDGLLTFASKTSAGSPVDFDGDNIYDFELIVSDGVYTSSVNLALTIIESFDTDGDGILDIYDIDDDNDLVPDVVEIDEGTDPLDANSFLDEDKNGVPDFVQRSEAQYINYQFPLGVSVDEGGFAVVDLSNVTSVNGPVSITVRKFQGLNYKFRDNVMYIYADYVNSDQNVNIDITLSDGVEVITHVFPVYVNDVTSYGGKVELVREAKALAYGLRLRVIEKNISAYLNYKWYIDGELLTSEYGNIFTLKEQHFTQEYIVIKVEASSNNFESKYTDGIEVNRTSFLAELAQVQEKQVKPTNVAGSTSLLSLIFTVCLLLVRKLKTLSLIKLSRAKLRQLTLSNKAKLIVTSLLVLSIASCSATTDTKYELSSELAESTQTVNISLDESDPLYIAKLEHEAEKERIKLENIKSEIEREDIKRNERTHISTIGF